jgi:hypothetical protein
MVYKPPLVEKGGVVHVSRRFPIFARLIAAIKVFNVVVHSWPNEITLYDFDGFVLTHMVGNLRVMDYLAYYSAAVIFC